MTATPPRQDEWLNGWWLNCSDGLNGVEANIDLAENSQGTAPVHLRSARSADFRKNDIPKLTKAVDAAPYLGQKLRMTGWVKTNAEISTHLWIRVDPDFDQALAERFDNMANRPIPGQTDWSKYDLVVDVPVDSTKIVYGIFIFGPGEVWLGDVSFETADKSEPCTGSPPEAHSYFESKSKN
jgi:hypothetical protein